MLSKVRGTLKGPLAWVVVILLILAFALWGVPSVSQLFVGSAIKVGGDNFSQAYVTREFDQAFQRSARDSGGQFTREAAIASGLPQQVVDRIVVQSALDQYTERMNLALPREAIRDYLQTNENFQNPATGQFDRPTLEAILTSNGLSVEAFEERIKGALMQEQLIDSLVAGSPVPKPFMDQMLLRETERRRIAYLTITADMAGEAAEPSPEALQAYYSENESAFTAPEYRTFDLLMLRNDDFREGLETPEEEIRRLYEVGRERLYDRPERRTIYQLTYPTEAEALAAIAELNQGRPFENLAEARGVTLDAATFADAQKRDLLDPAVSDAAFAEGLEAGAVLDPVRSLFGWTVVQIVDVTPAESRSFEDVRAEIEEDYLRNDLRLRLQDALDEIEEVRDTGAELIDAAGAVGLALETIGPVDSVSFTSEGFIVDNVPGEALAEAFRLDEGEQSEALRLNNEDGWFIVSLREIIPPALRPYESVADEVEQRWRADERRDRVAAAVAEIKAAIAGGETLDTVAERYARAPIEIVIDRRFQNDVISQSFNDAIFFASVNEVVSAPAGGAGAQVVAEIREVGFGRNMITAAEQAQLAELIGFQLDQELVEAFVDSIREDYGVRINNSQIEAIFADRL